MTRQKIVVLGTGGTIAGAALTPGDLQGYTAGQVAVSQLLRSLPTTATMLTACAVEAEQLAQIDSKDMDLGVWQLLAQRCLHWLGQADVRAIVITHGTDTLEETAWFLQSVLPASLLADRPVVLTCAMRPTTALVPDGPQNLLDALTVAATPAAAGVLVACAGVIHGAREVQKVHPYRLDAFGSGETGPVGFVEAGRVRALRPWPADGFAGEAAAAGQLLAALTACPRVEIVMGYAAARGDMVGALVRDGVRGLVVAGTGNGTLHKELEAALLRAREQGVAVVRATRCALGVVVPGRADILPDSGGLSPVKARITLMLSLLASSIPNEGTR